MQYCYLIDDESIFNLISSKIISRSGWQGEVRVFISARTALEEIKMHIANEGNLPDFIFLDIRMPEMDGFQFLEELINLPKEPLKFIRVFMLSSSLDQKEIIRSKQFPMVKGFLSKPMDIQTIKDIFYNKFTEL
jgi:two-component system chemotaxis response regulator CheY